MQKISDAEFIYSPSDLVHFLSCNHSTALDIKSFNEEMEKAKESATNQLLQKRGYEHEAAHLARLKQEGKRVVEIPKEPKLQERARLTLEALRSGADVVFQGVFFNGIWRGDADFLVKIDTPSVLGDFSYEVQDTKLARHGEPKFIIQLCAYTDMLADVQGIRPKMMHLVLGNNQQLSFKADDFFYYYLYAKRRFEAFVAAPPADSYPEPCKHCKYCKWSDRCKAQWQGDDHLSLVANIQRSHIDKLRTEGVTTVAALAGLDPTTKIPDLNHEVFQRLRAQASLQVHKRSTGADKCEVIPFPPGKGFNRLPAPDAGDLFFDMEGDPLHPDGLEYLFGCFYFAKLKQNMFVPFWAHSHDEECVAFGQFMQFLEDHLKEFPNAHIYHYNHYETTALKRLACRYGVAEEQLDNLLRQRKFVDLLKVVRESVRVSEPAYSIKNMETFYMEKRAGAVATAGDSIVAYNEWRETHDDLLLRQIAEYNEMDCISTFKLRDWLLGLRPEGIPWFKATMADGKETPERKEWEIEYEAFQHRLLDDADEADREMRQRIVHLLEFHNREAKPQWWAHFERQDKFEDEIIDDTECLGGLTLIGAPEPEKRSLIYTYSFPEQEYKLKPGDQPIIIEDPKNGINTAGTIHELDEDRHIIKIKRGNTKGQLPGKLNLGPPSPFDSKVIRAAVYRVADSIAAGRSDYQALLDILNRIKPRLNGKAADTPILGGGDLLAESIRAAAELNNSYLFIQGPPGAGKTYTSAHIIIALLQQGKRVGVSANSHKAIHNLLDEVELVAAKEKFSFRGIKKASSGNDDSHYEGHNIHSVSKNEDIGSASLLAGTVYLFADERFDRQLDYLIIEEAGQVSVANVIAMGASARNIILVGDQMQLGQPIQGVHPGEAGLSILEFLLGDLATIPPDRGIFLNNTRRLNPSICAFISNAFYDGRLSSDEENSKRRLIFTASVKGITPEGIHFLPIDHSGCSQKSVEESALIKEYYHALLQQKFHDKDGTERQLQLDDILVVSPYNVQVNHLRAILPPGARVGTVDKFQGQEAPVVLFSMVTSSAEDLPRNIEFLYSKNRLNVALSRAQCLAVVVANPKLLEIPCGTIDQLRLVNTICWLGDYAAKLKTGGA